MSWLRALQSRFNETETFRPVSADLLAEAERTLGKLPATLRDLYLLSNGLRCRSFTLFPVFDPDAPKKTWESIQRANDLSQTDALGGDPDLLERFLVFADIGNGFAAFDRQDETIWFEEGEGELARTDLRLQEFVAVMLENAE